MTKQMQPHEARVVNEFVELTERIYKLEKFIDGRSDAYTSLVPDEKTLLSTQAIAMRTYQHVLVHRLCRWGYGEYVASLSDDLYNRINGAPNGPQA